MAGTLEEPTVNGLTSPVTILFYDITSDEIIIVVKRKKTMPGDKALRNNGISIEIIKDNINIFSKPLEKNM